MVGSSPRDDVRSLVLLGVLLLVLLVLTSWSFHASGVVSGTFQIDDILVCEELSGDLRPIPSSEGLAEGIKQVCLWFSYSRAREGDFLELDWKHEGKTIGSESFRIVDERGARAFYLLREDGSSLPPGNYTVTLHCNNREKTREFFSIKTYDDDATETEDDTESGSAQEEER